MEFSAKIIADSTSHSTSRLTTCELTYPRIIHCFHEDTEFLSQIGDEMPKFRTYDAIVSLRAKIAQYDNQGKIQFVAPLGSVKKPFDGELAVHRRKTFEFAVTPEHRMLSMRRTTGNEFRPHTDLASDWVGEYSSQRRILQAASLDDCYRQEFDFEELVLIAFFVADGHRTPQGRMQFHFRKTRKVDRVLECLRILGIPCDHRRYGDDHVIEFDPLPWVSWCYSEDGSKKYPDFIYKMNKDAWITFKEATLESDGNVDNREINTTSRTAAEQLQVLAFLNETAMNIRSYDGGLFKQKYQESNYVSFRSDKNTVELEKFTGNVVCFSVPSSYLCVRYKNFAFVSGNCEFMTHRMFSRNSASSRAIPVEKMLERVEQHPFVPIHWGANQKGMQARQELNTADQDHCAMIWFRQRDQAVEAVKNLSAIGLHKQIANRLLEPWMWITVICTGIDIAYENFFSLRCHPDAEPHIQKLAYLLRDAYDASTPKHLDPSQYHLPYTGFPGDEILSTDMLKKVSTARCARVSYLTHAGRRDVEADLTLHDRLKDGGHWSPFEHVATPAVSLHGRGGNFGGHWYQYRKEFPTELCRKAPR